MKRFALLIFFFVSICGGFAQSFSVKSFQALPMDMTASSLEGRRIDQNGEVAALIKIVTTETGFTFEAGALGIVDSQQCNGEVWVWVPRASRKITILNQKFGVLRDYRYPIEIEAERTYEMVLETKAATEPKPDDNMVRQQYLIFQITPPDAVLEVDDQLWPVSDGTARKFVNFGNYTYRVQAPNYHPDAGRVTVDDPNNKKIVKVNLRPNFGWVEVRGGNAEGAMVYVDNAYVGKAPCKSEALKSGEHTVKIVREMYAPYTERITVSDNETTTLSPKLTADFARVTLTVDADAEIWVNNEKKGNRTWTGDLASGSYRIECRMDSHEPSVTIKDITNTMDGQTITLAAPRPIYGSLNVESTPDFAKIYIDGQPMGETPNFIAQIVIGSHELKLTKEGYDDYTETITLAKGERKQVYATLNNNDYCKNGREYYDKKDYAEVLKWFSLAAEQGNAEGQNYLGFFYRQGLGVDQDYSAALKWFKKAADQGFAAGQCNMGDMYQHGLGVDQDFTEAMKWYRKAADQGYEIGQCDMGYMYRQGFGVTQDYSEAIKWYKKAAEQGFEGGQINLGVMYDQGLGVTKDCMEAFKWYKKAADQGSAPGQSLLGHKYLAGQCVTQDYSEAVKWFRKAADQGNSNGQYWMGRMYEEGKGVPKNLDEAKRWYKLAADQGNEIAKKALSMSQGTKNIPEGALQGVFSISLTQKVYFSKGNLQYQASTNTWRFAEYQWDYIGDANCNISETYKGWIDLFGWGTGDYPTKSSSNSTDYSSFTDWGSNMGNGWRTLTKDEWEYVFDKRTTSSGIRYAKAKVNGVNGVILLPDNWKSSIYRLNNMNNSDASFSSNNISATEWKNTFSSSGAVFLPAAGYRDFHYRIKVSGVGTGGYYWLASPSVNNYAYYGRFYNNSSGTDYCDRYYGQGVRLVCPAEN